MSVKKSMKPRRKYDAEFKEDVLKMALTGRPVHEIATSLGINVGLIHKWKAQHAGVQGASQPLVPVVTADVSAAEHERIKTRLCEVEQERDILKKALGIFSRGI
jgi:transposase